MRSDRAYRVEFTLDPNYKNDQAVIEYLEQRKKVKGGDSSIAGACRSALYEVVLRNRLQEYERQLDDQGRVIDELRQEIAVLRRVVDKLA